jgi:hypothetical protein
MGIAPTAFFACGLLVAALVVTGRPRLPAHVGAGGDL